jgi:hypothetical protein
MDCTAFVGIVEGQRDCADEHGDDFTGECPTFADDGIDTPTIDEFHGEVLNTFGFTDVEEGHDVWVLEGSDDFAFATESGRKFRVAGELGREYLEGNRTAEDSVGSAVHPCHPATPDFGMNFITFESSPD